jgi:hypothetical protein
VRLACQGNPTPLTPGAPGLPGLPGSLCLANPNQAWHELNALYCPVQAPRAPSFLQLGIRPQEAQGGSEPSRATAADSCTWLFARGLTVWRGSCCAHFPDGEAEGWRVK